jgi:NADP-dependent 3-hydroxy acid dehydrogenase YdfG
MTHASGDYDLRVSKLFDYSNHIALVTGGATGLGEMAAQGFVQNGAKVYIASRKESELKKVCMQVSVNGCELGVDVRKRTGLISVTRRLRD